MNGIFNEQKETLLSIKREINLLHQQVDYLIRNEQPLGLLDLDVLMNRIHTLYDQLCSINLGGAPDDLPEDDEELPVDPQAIRAVFGIEDEPSEEEKPIEVETPIEVEKPAEEEPLQATTPLVEETPIIDNPVEEEPAEEKPVEIEPLEEKPVEIEPLEEEPVEEEPIEEEQPLEEEPEPEENEDAYFEEEVEEEPVPEETSAETPTSNDMGFILNFEPDDEPVPETPQEQEPIRFEEPSSNPSVFTTGDKIEMTIPHENIPTPNTPEAPEEEIEYEPVVIGDMEKLDDTGFELEQAETLGERYQQEQETTLGEKLRHGSVQDLQSAIGINDKFLFVNELFSGSMEKYNRAIENLNDLKTLNGALIYMNELRIELQWNSNNEAYKKLLELVHRKYEA